MNNLLLGYRSEKCRREVIDYKHQPAIGPLFGTGGINIRKGGSNDENQEI